MPYTFTERRLFDWKEPGAYHASHAAVKAIVRSKGGGIAVSQRLCIECQNFISAMAAHANSTKTVSEPDSMRIFFPNGTQKLLPHQ